MNKGQIYKTLLTTNLPHHIYSKPYTPPIMVSKLIVASPRGFCAGVVRAIDTVELALERFGKPIYVRHPIVHNTHVVKNLEKKGAIFVESLECIPKGSRVIFSAHGSPPALRGEAVDLGLVPIDAVCPLVTKVHLEAMSFQRQGYQIIYIGHSGHQEAVGTTAHAPMHLVEDVNDVKSLKIEGEKIVFLTQTTLSIDDTREVIAALKIKYPHIKEMPKSDICYATTNRQGAVKELSKQAELILVIGSKASSNSKRLVETAKYSGAESYLIEDKSKIVNEWFNNIETVGLTSGASAPETLVKEVIDYLREIFPEVEVTSLEFIKEDVKFNLPIVA